jgi:hypothetical protein
MDGHRDRLVHYWGFVASWQFFDSPEAIAIFWSRTEKALRPVTQDVNWIEHRRRSLLR